MSSPDHDRYALPDWQRAAYLGGGLNAVVAVTPDGDDSYWLALDDAGPTPYYAVPDHEQTGPLPPQYRPRRQHVPRPRQLVMPETARSVVCPTCRAPVGVGCLYHGRMGRRHHVTRERLALRIEQLRQDRR
jgi:hypothetical protein